MMRRVVGRALPSSYLLRPLSSSLSSLSAAPFPSPYNPAASASIAGAFPGSRRLQPSPPQAPACSRQPQYRLSHTKPPKFLSFYDTTIASYAAKLPRKISIRQLNEFGESAKLSSAKLVQSGRFLHRELPIRLAQRLQDFLHLPFIVGCNPSLQTVFQAYATAFIQMRTFPDIKTEADEAAYKEIIKDYIDDHQHIVTLLASACREARGYSDNAILDNFMERTLKSRIGIRLLVEQQVALHHPREGYTGVFSSHVSPRKIAQKCADVTSQMCQLKYGRVPRIVFNGDADLVFTYVPVHLEYILLEIFKNSFRATCEKHENKTHLPDITITICGDEHEVMMRISDQGGGYKPELDSKIWQFSFTTMNKDDDPDADAGAGGLFGNLTASNSNVIAGLGFGLPLSRAYAEYFGGSLELKSMHGYGTDAYLRLKRLDQDLTDNVYIT